MDPSEREPEVINRFGIRSTNVMLEGYYEPKEAIILVEDEKIHEIYIVSELEEESLSSINSTWKIEDYGNLYIFPGIIDCNVHLHSGYTSEWDNIYYSTNLAAAGGITTVVDNPIMTRSFKSGKEYVRVLEDRVFALKSYSRVDFAVFGLLEERTKSCVKEIVDLGVIGLKCYLVNVFQSTVGHIRPDDLQKTLDFINENHPELLLAFHPEIATERELYLSSPCRFVETGKRLDLNFEIKPLELGGAANKGSFMDEANQEEKLNNESTDSDDDYEGSELNTPSKLRSKIKKQKAKSDINQIVHFELLSYGDRNNKNVPEKQESSSDSEIDMKEGRSKESSPRGETNNTNGGVIKAFSVFSENTAHKKSSFEKIVLNEDKIVEVDSDDNPMTPKPANRSRLSNDSGNKKSFFYKNNPPTHENNDNHRDSNEIKLFNHHIEPAPTEISTKPTEEEEIKIEDRHQIQEIPLFREEEDDKEKDQQEVLSREDIADIDASDSISQTCYEKQSSKLEAPKINIHILLNPNRVNSQGSEFKKFLMEPPDEDDFSNPKSHKLPRFGLLPKMKSSIEISSTRQEFHSNSSLGQDKNGQDEHPLKFKKKLEILTDVDDQSPEARKNSNNSLSPLKRQLTPSSSLLNRRMGRKVSDNGALSARSNISSPSSDLSKISLLDLGKSPDNSKKAESAFNKNYKVFLANRPQSWEENGVSKIFLVYKDNYRLRILIQNMSLASSFLKVRKLKKKDEKYNSILYGETGVPYLLFSEKMVKKGETKYKASPPLREKENRRLLVEHLRLGGIDIVSSYHFYVPPRYKAIEDGSFRRAFDGFNSIGCVLQALWTVLQNYYNKKSKKYTEDLFYQRKMNSDILRKIYELLCLNPAKLLRIDHLKGSLKKGKDADIVVWDPNKFTPNITLPPDHLFCGKRLKGKICKTYLRGKVIFTDGINNNADNAPYARLISPSIL